MSPFMAGLDVPAPKGQTVPALIRTWTPLLVAYLVGWLASLGIAVDTETQGLITAAIGTVAAAAYYALVRLLERRFPWLSVLLGSKQQPTYLPPDATVTLPVPPVQTPRG